MGKEGFEIVPETCVLDDVVQETTLGDGLVRENFRVTQKPLKMWLQRAPK